MSSPAVSATVRRALPTAVRVAILLTLVAALMSLAGCGTTSTRATATPAAPGPNGGYRVVTASSVDPRQALPVPTGPVVLTVSGHLGAGVTNPVRLDMAGLETLGLVEYPTMDKQAEGRRATFRGVLLRRLLAAVGADRSTTLHTAAVNDFSVDIPVSDATAYPVLLATTVDGSRMPVDRYGPVRVIYPTDDTSLDPTVYDPRWIWQLTSIVVE
ncbi:MAG: molybdopterin-dependent oxidoreductase [Actinomycetota bacterium]|nr:molybdopterin-dependent oxidoreductase [Actinomycetota bacterium]